MTFLTPAVEGNLVFFCSLSSFLLYVFRVIYSRGDKLPERVDVELKSVIDKVEPTVIKNVGFDNSSYTLIATGE